MPSTPDVHGGPATNWLMQALADADERAKLLPRWAVEVNAAVEAFYRRNTSSELR